MAAKVECHVPVYEVNGRETSVGDRATVLVASHWNRSEMVVIRAADGQKFTVLSRDLIAAVANATNTGKPY